ncbi:MAG: 50S ribosomal protein L35 [Armatimonadota bacterium]
MKTKKAAAKRFKRTGSGKLVYSSQGQNHLAMKKSARRKRRLERDKELTGKDAKNIETLLPYD